jgi:hypothetical protein
MIPGKRIGSTRVINASFERQLNINLLNYCIPGSFFSTRDAHQGEREIY